MGTLSVLQEGGVTVLFSGLRLAARGVPGECIMEPCSCIWALRGRRFGAFQLYVLVGFKGDVRPLGGPGGAPARPSGGWG